MFFAAYYCTPESAPLYPVRRRAFLGYRHRRAVARDPSQLASLFVRVARTSVLPPNPSFPRQLSVELHVAAKQHLSSGSGLSHHLNWASHYYHIYHCGVVNGRQSLLCGRSTVQKTPSTPDPSRSHISNQSVVIAKRDGWFDNARHRRIAHFSLASALL